MWNIFILVRTTWCYFNSYIDPWQNKSVKESKSFTLVSTCLIHKHPFSICKKSLQCIQPRELILVSATLISSVKCSVKFIKYSVPAANVHILVPKRIRSDPWLVSVIVLWVPQSETVVLHLSHNTKSVDLGIIKRCLVLFYPCIRIWPPDDAFIW
jgi:hypothetical protein